MKLLGELDSSAQFRRAFPSKVLIAENLRVSAWTFSEWVAHYGKFRYHATFPLRLQVTKKNIELRWEGCLLEFSKNVFKTTETGYQKKSKRRPF